MAEEKKKKKKDKSIEDQLKDGEIEIVKAPEDPLKNKQGAQVEDPTKPSLEAYIGILQQMRSLKKHLTSAPTFVPKNFYDSIQFYDTGGVLRLYLYVNKVWRYVVLT